MDPNKTLLRYHLIHDEIDRVDTFKQPVAFRVRVWRAPGKAAIALVSQLPDNPPPSWACRRIANYVLAAYCGFPRLGMWYFEYEMAPSGRMTLFEECFQVFGHGMRMRLHRPNTLIIDTSALELRLDQKIDW